MEELSDKADFVAWIVNNSDPPRLIKICDEFLCRFLPGDEWDEVKCVYVWGGGLGRG